jgi:hypothetical protein
LQQQNNARIAFALVADGARAICCKCKIARSIRTKQARAMMEPAAGPARFSHNVRTLIWNGIMKDCSNERVFVIVIDDVPILAFQARSMSEALELGREAWLIEDLKHLTSDRAPIWDGKAPIRTRSARPAEAQIYRQGIDKQAVRSGDLPIVFLVSVDRELEMADATPPGAFPPRR